MRKTAPIQSLLTVRSQHLNATSNFIKEKRLAQKAEQLHRIGVATERMEKKLPMTSDSLNKLGAGQEFGA